MEIAANGFLRTPNLHDGYLIGLELVEEAMLRVRLRDLKGNLFVMELSGLKHLLATEFKQGNIIQSIEVISGIPPDKTLIRNLIGEMHPSVGDPHLQKYENTLGQLIVDVVNGNLTLVYIGSSYGCELTALCQAVRIGGG